MTVGNVEQTPSSISTAPATTALPNQHRVATNNFNSQIDEQGNMGRVDVSNTMCYQTHQSAIPQFLYETLTQKLIAIQQKTTHLHMSQHSPINDHSHQHSPPTVPPHLMQQQQQQQQVMSKHYPHISLNQTPHYQRMMQPLNINTQQNTYHQQFYHQINWNQQLTHYQHQ